MTFIPIISDSKVDPRYYYQNLFSSGHAESSEMTHSSYLTVTAIVHNLVLWKQLSGVTTKTAIPSGNSWIITATIPRSHFGILCTKTIGANIQFAP